MELLIPLVLLSIVTIFIVSNSSKNSEHLDNEIKRKQAILSEINNQIKNRKIDTSTGLTKTQVNVLNIYETSNIKIPVEIIEELSHLNITDEKEILSYIENQRYFWKLENTKKPFRMDVKR